MNEPLERHYGKNLPHINVAGQFQVITFRLRDSLPQDKLLLIAEQIKKYPKSKRYAYERALMEYWLNQGCGKCLLRHPKCAEIVKECLIYSQIKGYKLISWVIMPNHVHVLVKMGKSLKIEEMLRTWKSFTAHQINHFFNKEGPIWQPDYFDRYIRNQRHFSNVIRYIERHISPGAVLWDIPTSFHDKSTGFMWQSLER